jgi:hypothetical protein
MIMKDHPKREPAEPRAGFTGQKENSRVIIVAAKEVQR